MDFLDREICIFFPIERNFSIAVGFTKKGLVRLVKVDWLIIQVLLFDAEKSWKNSALFVVHQRTGWL